MLDAHDGSGHPLEIRSAHFRESRRAGKPSPILIRGEMYRYFVRAEEVSQKVLSFEILDLSGKILGAETVPFELRNATAWEANAL